MATFTRFTSGAVLLIFLAVSAYIGIRMLLLAHRTRKVPEAAIAVAFLIGGVFGYSMLTLNQALTDLPAAWRTGLATGGLAAQYVGAIAQILFAWRVFRPGVTWAMLGFWGLTAALGAAFVVEVVSGAVFGYVGGAMTTSWWAFGMGMRSLASVALAVESVLAARKLKRQFALGLVDRDTLLRVQRWGGGAAFVALVYLISIANRGITGEGLMASAPAISLLTSACMLAGAGLWFLAFFPRRTQAAEET